MPPITLTKQQFGSTAAGKKPGASYSGYLGYVARHRAAKLAQPPADPLGQTSPGDITAQVDRYAGMYGTPQNDQQIQSSAQSQIDPIIAAITKKINDQASTATGAISTNSQALAKALGGVDYGQPYAQAKTEQAAVDAALQQSLGGAGGTGLANDLSSRLAQIGDPSVAAAAGGIADRGAAIGGTQIAQGSSNLGALIASAAAAKEYGAKMPGIAQLSGLQDIAGVNRQTVTDVGNQTAQVTSQLPQIVQALRAEAQNTRSNRAQAAAQLYQALTGQNITKATASAGLAGDRASLDYQYANANADNAIAQQNADANTARAQAASERAAAAAAKKAHPTLTPSKAADIATKAAKDAENLYHGVTKPNSKDPANPTVVSYTQTYQDAIKTLLQRYPSLGKAGVLKLVNSWYKPGEFGRPAKPPRGTTPPPGYQPGTYGKAISTPQNPGGFLPKP